jgi:hypothetical protein
VIEADKKCPVVDIAYVLLYLASMLCRLRQTVLLKSPGFCRTSCYHPSTTGELLSPIHRQDIPVVSLEDCRSVEEGHTAALARLNTANVSTIKRI